MSHSAPGYRLCHQVPPTPGAFSRITKSSWPASSSRTPVQIPPGPAPMIATRRLRPDAGPLASCPMLPSPGRGAGERADSMTEPGTRTTPRSHWLQPSVRTGREVRRGSRRRHGPCRPSSTMPITPALRTTWPSVPRSSTAAVSPAWRPSSCAHGLRNPVISTTASEPRRSRAPVGSARRSMPRVVMFSPISPEATANPRAASSSSSSRWMRCTCRRLGRVGSRATRERCCTVAPGVRVVFDADACHQEDARHRGLRDRVRRAPVDGGDVGTHAGDARAPAAARRRRVSG